MKCTTRILPVVFCLFAFTLARPIQAQITTPFAGCGTFVQGAECVFFDADGSGLYLLDDSGGFELGDRVYVTGMLDPTCVTTCMQGDGCIDVDTIIAGCDIVCDCSKQGDCDGDGVIGPVDVVLLVAYAFRKGPDLPADPTCPLINRGDWNCDGRVDLTDVILMANHVYRQHDRLPCNPCPEDD